MLELIYILLASLILGAVVLNALILKAFLEMKPIIKKIRKKQKNLLRGIQLSVYNYYSRLFTISLAAIIYGVLAILLFLLILWQTEELPLQTQIIIILIEFFLFGASAALCFFGINTTAIRTLLTIEKLDDLKLEQNYKEDLVVLNKTFEKLKNKQLKKDLIRYSSELLSKILR